MEALNVGNNFHKKNFELNVLLEGTELNVKIA